MSGSADAERNEVAGELLRVFPPHVVCPHCHWLLLIPEDFANDYFQGHQGSCSECGHGFDWWNVILHIIRQKTPFLCMNVLGAQTSILRITMNPNTRTTLNLGDYNIPSDARILDVSYTSYGTEDGTFIPVETNTTTFRRHLIPHAIDLYPIPVAEGTYGEREVTVGVSWLIPLMDDAAWGNLADAFQNYLHDRNHAAIVPANVAVELRLHHLLAELLDGVASRDHIESLLEQGATYSHQLNVLLPSYLRFTNAPHLPDCIRGLLNRLRKLRNRMAHNGKLKEPVGDNEVTEYLCAALFGVHYLDFVRPILLGSVDS